MCMIDRHLALQQRSMVKLVRMAASSCGRGLKVACHQVAIFAIFLSVHGHYSEYNLNVADKRVDSQ